LSIFSQTQFSFQNGTSEETPEENGHFKPQTCESKGKPTEDGSLGIRAWSEEYAPYKQGTVVRYRGKYYVAVTAFSSAEPGLYLPWLIYVRASSSH